MYPGMNGHIYNEYFSALYSSLSRPLWALSTGWVMYACMNGFGGIINTILSSRVFTPLSRVSYSAFLTHPVIMVVLYGNQSYPIKFSHYLMIYFTLGHIILTFLFAFVLTITFEMPILSIERTLRFGHNPSRGMKLSENIVTNNNVTGKRSM